LDTLARSSVFLNTAAASRNTGILSVATDQALRTLQGGSSLTIYQALRSSRPIHPIDAYAMTVPVPGAPVTTVSLPIKVNSASYGFLNSSLTVFTDEFASFGGIGQTFNGLTALNVTEPASLLVLAAGLAGMGALRRRFRAV
jgi:hypothetical protein